ncbi:hypothetical protein HDU97_006918 [Phlyctochytrium planicorne]|nr:hypothetical protein HDU97_006918 [Phlyctochytrium planicorne]
MGNHQNPSGDTRDPEVPWLDKDDVDFLLDRSGVGKEWIRFYLKETHLLVEHLKGQPLYLVQEMIGHLCGKYNIELVKATSEAGDLRKILKKIEKRYMNASGGKPRKKKNKQRQAAQQGHERLKLPVIIKLKKPNSPTKSSKRTQSSSHFAFPLPSILSSEFISSNNAHIKHMWELALSKCRIPPKFHCIYDFKAYIDSFKIKAADPNQPIPKPTFTTSSFLINPKVLEALRTDSQNWKTKACFYFLPTWKARNIDGSRFKVSAGKEGQPIAPCEKTLSNFPAIDITDALLRLPISGEEHPRFEYAVTCEATGTSDIFVFLLLVNELSPTERLAKVYERSIKVLDGSLVKNLLPLGFTVEPADVRNIWSLQEQLLNVLPEQIDKNQNVNSPSKHLFKMILDDENDAVNEEGSEEGEIREKKQAPAADEVVVSETVLSFRCPFLLSRIEHPARGRLCSHTQCFDARGLVFVVSADMKWKCIICNEFIFAEVNSLCQHTSSYNLKDLFIDHEFLKLLKKYPEEAKCVIDAQGVDKMYVEVEAPKAEMLSTPSKKKRKDCDNNGVIEVSDDADEVVDVDAIVLPKKLFKQDSSGVILLDD